MTKHTFETISPCDLDTTTGGDAGGLNGLPASPGVATIIVGGNKPISQEPLRMGTPTRLPLGRTWDSRGFNFN